MTDVFAIQSELAREIASALKATLSPDEQERIETKPTQNGDAYLLHLQAHEIFSRPDRHHDDLVRVESLYEKAVNSGHAEFANGVRLVYPMEERAMQFSNLCQQNLRSDFQLAARPTGQRYALWH